MKLSELVEDLEFLGEDDNEAQFQALQDPECQVKVQLVGNEFEDGDVLTIDGDVGIKYDPILKCVVIKALSNELPD